MDLRLCGSGIWICAVKMERGMNDRIKWVVDEQSVYVCSLMTLHFYHSLRTSSLFLGRWGGGKLRTCSQ